MAFTIEVFRNMLRINKHRLDDELEIQAETQERISSHLAQLNSRQLELKKTLDQEAARIVAELKEASKISDTAADKEAKRDRAYITAWQAWLVARQEHEEWAGLYEAWKARGYQLKTLADLHGDQYFAVTSAGAPVVRPGQEDGMRSRIREASARAAESKAPEPAATPPIRRRTPIT